MKKSIKGIIFDYGCVISTKFDEKEAEEICLILGLEKDSFYKIYYAIRPEYDKGALNTQEYWRKIAGEYNIFLSEEEIERLKELDIKGWTVIDEKMLSFIKETRKNISKMAILSNMPSDILEYLEKSFEWLNLFDTLVFSCNPGINKPDREIYMICLERLGLAPEECVFIDDTERNIQAAEKLGLNTILYKSFDEFKLEFIQISPLLYI
ncbi:MAG: Alpha-D-glucose-1-phosphate phosphatase YihX [bacterium ADurb.Bin363]|nr:MAG: Alpha-D-glucose-1-phosphate phosphatase YihX [bacterium ADurb.Bin363]